MRTFLVALMALPWLAPGLAAASTYKCVVDGKTTYSQEPCGANAQQVETSKALSGVGVATPAAAGGKVADTPAERGKTPSAAPTGTQGAGERQTDCAARRQAYQASLACFARYRINANVMDPEAFKHCQTVAEPTDCAGE